MGFRWLWVMLALGLGGWFWPGPGLASEHALGRGVAMSPGERDRLDKDGKAMMKPPCAITLQLNATDNPWRGFTGSYIEEQAGLRVAAVDDLAGFAVPAALAAWRHQGEPLLAVDGQGRRVVVNARLFGDLQRPDVTAIAAGQRLEVGMVKEWDALGSPRELVFFLLRANLIRAYAHLEAELCLEAESLDPQGYRATFSGHHTYCTQRCQQAPLHFTVSIERASGRVAVQGE